MSYGAIALLLGLLTGLAVALLAAPAALAQRRHRRGRGRSRGAGLWFAATVLPDGPCAGEDAPGDCSDLYHTL